MVTSDCDAIQLVAGGGSEESCTITNRPTQAVFSVGKSFSDGNPVAGVVVTPACTNGALITSTSPADATAYENADVAFTLRYFTPGAVCTAGETTVVGYTQGVAVDDCSVDQPITDVEGDNACEFYNIQDPTIVTVFKVYGVPNELLDPEVEILLACPTASITSTNPVMTVNGIASFVVEAFPWSGEHCEATEIVPPGYLQVGATGCDTLNVRPGSDSPECTITNSLSAEIITTLSQYGLMLLTLLLMCAGLVGFRRLS